jgi:hypothetical protein
VHLKDTGRWEGKEQLDVAQIAIVEFVGIWEDPGPWTPNNSEKALA